MNSSPGGLWMWMEIEFIFTYRSVEAKIKILSYRTQGPFEPCFLPRCEKLCRWSVWENLLLCWIASMAPVIGEHRKQAESLILSPANFFQRVEQEIKREQQCRLWAPSRAIGIQYLDNHPTSTEVNPGSLPKRKLTKKRAEAVMNERDAERDVHVLGLSFLECPSCALLPAQPALLTAAGIRKKEGEAAW